MKQQVGSQNMAARKRPQPAKEIIATSTGSYFFKSGSIVDSRGLTDKSSHHATNGLKEPVSVVTGDKFNNLNVRSPYDLKENKKILENFFDIRLKRLDFDVVDQTMFMNTTGKLDSKIFPGPTKLDSPNRKVTYKIELINKKPPTKLVSLDKTQKSMFSNHPIEMSSSKYANIIKMESNKDIMPVLNIQSNRSSQA